MRQRAVGKSQGDIQTRRLEGVDRASADGHGVSDSRSVRDAQHARRFKARPLAAVAALALALLVAAFVLRPHIAAPAWQLDRSGTGQPARGDDNGTGHTTSPPLQLVYGPALGAFPRGCRWREVVRRTNGSGSDSGDSDSSSSSSTCNGGGSTSSSSGGGDEETSACNSSVGTLPFDPPRYQYWDDVSQSWSSKQPPACRLSAVPNPGPPGWRFLNNTPRTEVVAHAKHTEYRNLWYNNGRWYALVDGPKPVAPWRASRNVEITPLHVADARAFASAVDWAVVPGDTLLIDYAFFTHPTAIGHWWELAAPLYSVLKSAAAAAAAAAAGGAADAAAGGAKSGGGGVSRPPDQVVLLHFERRHLAEWARAVAAAALGVGRGAALPPVALQERAPNKYVQITMPLEGVPADRWIVFDRILAARDVFTGGGRTFANEADARALRADIYALYGLPPPARRVPLPRTVTFQRKRANRRLTNEAEVLSVLGEHGTVRVVEFDAWTPVKTQLEVIASTALFASAHTSNLANAPLLQPGSAVVEFIPRHWSWLGLDRSFKEQTLAMGDLHHYAWRANGANESRYIRPGDARRFAAWTKGACAASEPCVEAQTNTDLTVDAAALRALLAGRMPLVASGASVADAELPWPPEL